MKTETCAICLEDFEEGDIVSELIICGHEFHKVCLEGWRARYNTSFYIFVTIFYQKSIYKFRKISIVFCFLIISNRSKFCAMCRSPMCYTHECIRCNRIFDTRYSVQVVCEMCMSIDRFLDLVHEYYARNQWFHHYCNHAKHAIRNKWFKINKNHELLFKILTLCLLFSLSFYNFTFSPYYFTHLLNS